jgi:transposase InsO family protein
VSAKYELMRAEKANYPVAVMAELLKVARSGFYAWAKAGGEPGPRSAARALLAARVKQIWDESKGRFGFRMVRAKLAQAGVDASEWAVRKVMRDLGIQGVRPRAWRKTTQADPLAPSRPDLVERRFRPPVPTTFLVGDITYLKTGEGWLYLATVIDLTTRMVVGWQLADNMRTPLIVDALKMAWDAGYVAGNAVAHSDLGAQYTSREYAKTARAMGVRLSVGKAGTCFDNAVAESFFGSLKNEMYHLEKFATKAKAKMAVAEYIEIYYNRQRPHSTLGYRTPAQAMADHFPPIQNQALAA